MWGRLFGTAVPPPKTAAGLSDRLEMQALMLAEDLAEMPRSGWQGADWSTRVTAARRLVWVRWLWETGRLTEPLPEIGGLAWIV